MGRKLEKGQQPTANVKSLSASLVRSLGRLDGLDRQLLTIEEELSLLRDTFEQSQPEARLLWEMFSDLCTAFHACVRTEEVDLLPSLFECEACGSVYDAERVTRGVALAFLETDLVLRKVDRMHALLEELSGSVPRSTAIASVSRHIRKFEKMLASEVLKQQSHILPGAALLVTQ